MTRKQLPSKISEPVKEKAIEKRGEMIEKWMSEGVSPDKIKSWAADPAKRALVNTMALFDAGAFD